MEIYYFMMKCWEHAFSDVHMTRMPAIPTSIQLYTEHVGQSSKVRKKLKA